MGNVKVCDALCGSGKTSACIRMMNEREDTKFIFVTQFLSEVERIKNACKKRKFLSPEEEGHTKLSDIRLLLKEGANIATTHALFVSYTEDIKELIANQRYVLVLDESVDVLCMAELARCDIEILKKSNTIEEDEDGFIRWIDKDYEVDEREGLGKFHEEMNLAKSKNLLQYDEQHFFWSIPPELFTCFQEVYVLTYLFHAQTLRCFFELYEIPYQMIGVKKTQVSYAFCPPEEMQRARDLRQKIHVLESDKLNEIGNQKTALSFNYYRKESNDEKSQTLDRLRKNLMNLVRNIYNAPARQVMWTTYKDYRPLLSDPKIANGFLVYNKRASNEYADRRYLAYCVNNFMRPWEVGYFKARGVECDQDGYALSILVQWMFRSAIRNGEEIWIYVPSARMRYLLTTWLDNLAEGRDLEPVTYKAFKERRKKNRKGSKNEDVQ